jgi:hypothetical protein
LRLIAAAEKRRHRSEHEQDASLWRAKS